MNLADWLTNAVQILLGNAWVLFFVALGGILIVVYSVLDLSKFIYNRIQQPRLIAKQEYQKHSDSLFSQFNMAFDKTRLIHGGFEFDSFCNMFTYKEQFLRHVFTGYEELYNSIVAMVSIDREIRTGQRGATQQQKEESNRTHEEYKRLFEKLAKDITLKTHTFGGICEDCKENYEKAYKTTEMTDKLKSFTTPF